MNSHSIALFISVFLACAVEMVEAVTIVLAAGTARSWRAALQGVVSAFVLLALIIFTFGPAITHLPIWILRSIVGGLLLTFGMQWLRKAIFRASGHKAIHDEEGIFAHEIALAKVATKRNVLFVHDWYAFTMAFKGVLLEGLEVVFLVLTFGAIQHEVPLASLAALSALVVVIISAIAIHKPLSRVPENSLKFIVGIMCVTFGIFWGVEGSGAHWPFGNSELILILPLTALLSWVLIQILKNRVRVSHRKPVALPTNNIFQKFVAFWYDFIVGDDWRIALLVFFSFGLTHYIQYWQLIPIAMTAALIATVIQGSAKRDLTA